MPSEPLDRATRALIDAALGTEIHKIIPRGKSAFEVGASVAPMNPTQMKGKSMVGHRIKTRKAAEERERVIVASIKAGMTVAQAAKAAKCGPAIVQQIRAIRGI